MKSDSPIFEKKQDLFERYIFAQEIVKGIMNSFQNGQASLAIGINGEWGSGKTSLLEFIKKEISIQTSSEQPKTIIFDFNPWIFTGQTDLQQTFLTNLGVQLGAINPELKQLGDDVVFIASLIEAPNKFNPDLHSKFAIGGTTGVIKRIVNRLRKEPTLLKLKNKIDEELNDTRIKVFIFIDDIDRLTPNEILNIFRLVKLNANFKNTFFFLAYDKNAIVEAIYADLHIDGGKYIEKIIQLDYTLPKLSDDILEAFFFSEMVKMGEQMDFSYDRRQLSRLWENGLSSYYHNLRQIYRFFNAFEIRYAAIRNDINVIDFIGIETIRLFELNIYEWIFKHKNDLVADRENYFDALFHKEKKAFSELIKTDSELIELKATEGAKNLLIKLFESLHLPEPNLIGKELDLVQLEKGKRIVHKDYFDHYFTFRISNRNVPQKLIDSFLKADDAKKTAILDEYQNSLFSVLVRRIGFHMEETDFNQSFVKFFLDYSDSKSLEDSQFDTFNSNGLFIIISMLNEISLRFGYQQFFNEVIAKTDSYSRFYLIGQMKDRLKDGNNFDSVKDFPMDLLKDNADRIRGSFIECVQIITKNYLALPFDHPIGRINESLRLLNQNDHNQYISYISTYFEDDEKSILLFYCSLTFVGMGGFTSYFIQEEHHILPEMTIKKFDERLSKIDLDTYSGKNKEILALFYQLKEKGFPKFLSYTIDLKEVKL